MPVRAESGCGSGKCPSVEVMGEFKQSIAYWPDYFIGLIMPLTIKLSQDNLFLYESVGPRASDNGSPFSLRSPSECLKAHSTPPYHYEKISVDGLGIAMRHIIKIMEVVRFLERACVFVMPYKVHRGMQK